LEGCFIFEAEEPKLERGNRVNKRSVEAFDYQMTLNRLSVKTRICEISRAYIRAKREAGAVLVSDTVLVASCFWLPMSPGSDFLTTS
jgi:hypothetical protein